jgi:cytochrome c-type protein NapB
VRAVKTRILAAVMALGLLAAGAVHAQEVKPMPGDAAVDHVNAPPPVFSVNESGRVARNYRQQPPVIPHRIDRYEIDVKVNQCLRCHDWPNNVQENAPMVSATHYLDRDGNKLDHVSSNRWFCVQCHVPQADAKPLVENNFQPAVTK